jgi:hypothetical protein
MPEPALRDAPGSAAERTSKLFRVHRHEPVFRAFAREPRLLGYLAELIGPDRIHRILRDEDLLLGRDASARFRVTACTRMPSTDSSSACASRPRGGAPR